MIVLERKSVEKRVKIGIMIYVLGVSDEYLGWVGDEHEFVGSWNINEVIRYVRDVEEKLRGILRWFKEEEFRTDLSE